jgi:sulfur relay (sulfurtransferase) complex TusBCD TusD component (DsrE family)
VAAALRRGMLDEGEAGKNGVDGNNIHPAFRISGLGQLIEAGIQSESVMRYLRHRDRKTHEKSRVLLQSLL